MEKKNFSKKLTLSISSSTKNRSDKIRYAKSQNKNSIIIEKKNIRSGFKKTNQQFSRDQVKSSAKTVKIFNKNLHLINKDSEKRKLAEQRATRRVKGQVVEEKVVKSKPIVKKRSVPAPKRKKQEVKWTCVVGPCDFIDENGNLKS